MRWVRDLFVFLVLFIPLVFDGFLSTEAQEDDGLEKLSWAMFRGNARHSGCSPYNTTGNDGGVKWRYNHRNFASRCGSIALGPDGTLYYTAWYPNSIFAVHSNGTEKWFLPLDDEEAKLGHSTPAVGLNGSIYIGAGKYLYSIDPDGKIAWRFETWDLVQSSPSIAPNGTIYFGSDDKNLYAVSPEGTRIWKFTTNTSVRNSPAIGPDGTIVFFGNSHVRGMIALHPNGTLKWVLEMDYSSTNSVAIDTDGTIYCNGKVENLYAINPNGTIKWTYPTVQGVREEGHMVLHPAIGPDGTVYSGSVDGLYSINPDGTLKWKANLTYPVYSPSVSADGTVFVQSVGVHAVNPNGSSKWHFDADNYFVVTELVIGEDGTIYFYNQVELIALHGEQEVISQSPVDPCRVALPLIIMVLLIGILALIAYKIEDKDSS